MAEIIYDGKDFVEMINHPGKTVMVDFYADWCGPCKMLSPILKELAEERADSLVVCKVNVDEYPELAAKFQISSIPNVVLFKDSKPTGRFVGYRTKAEIEGLL